MSSRGINFCLSPFHPLLKYACTVGTHLNLYLKRNYRITRAQTIYVCEIAFLFPLAQNKINAPINDRVCDVVADRFQCGTSWKTLAGGLQPKIEDGVIDDIEEDKGQCPKECCRAMLKTWYQRRPRSATSKELMRCLTNMGLANVNWQIMRELELVKLENIPLSER